MPLLCIMKSTSHETPIGENYYEKENSSFVKKLAQNMNFQKYDLKEKLKIERKNKRDVGVGI